MASESSEGGKGMKREYQSFGVDVEGKITHAGTTKHSRMSQRVASKIQRDWERWREEYLDANPGDFPLRHVAPTVSLIVHPVGAPDKQYTFAV